MGLFTDPNDPTNTYGQAIKDRISDYSQRLGNALLNSGTGSDATQAGQEAYNQHVLESAQNGQAPLSREEFARQRNPNKAR